LLACLTVFVWQRRSVESGAELAVVLAAATIWVLGGAAGHRSATLAGKIVATKIQYIGFTAPWIANVIKFSAAKTASSHRASC
jgi:hypothetical protein